MFALTDPPTLTDTSTLTNPNTQSAAPGNGQLHRPRSAASGEGMMAGAITPRLETRREAALRPSLAYRLCKLCSPAVAADLTLLVTAASVAGTAVLSHALYYPLVLASPVLLADYALIGLAVALAYFFTARFVFQLDFEKLEQGLESGSQSVKALLVAVTIFLLAVFLTQSTEVHSRGWFLAWMASAALVLVLLHVAAARLFEKAVRLPDSPYRRRVAVFGTEDLGAAFAAHLIDHGSGRTDLVHRSILWPDPASETAASETATSETDDAAFRHQIATFMHFCRTHSVSEVVVALPWAQETRMMAAVHAFATLPVDVRLAPDKAGFALARHQLLGGAGLPLVTVSTRPIRDWGKLLKELFDRLGASLILAFLAPLFLCVAASIKLESKGPVFFKQQRNGFNHRTFMIWKFRSMIVDAETPSGPYRQATRDDPRITRVGAFLRRTSIDELPQLINVVRGEMSLVGPRPHPIALDDQYMSLIDQYATRHAVLPGITGWAQVNGYRGETDTEEKMAGRIAHDLHYIRNWSFSLDFGILCLTVIRGFVHKNAY